VALLFRNLYIRIGKDWQRPKQKHGLRKSMIAVIVAVTGAVNVMTKGMTMTDLTQKYLDKELVDSIPEKLPPSYDEWLDTQQPTMPEMDEMAKAFKKICSYLDTTFEPF